MASHSIVGHRTGWLLGDSGNRACDLGRSVLDGLVGEGRPWFTVGLLVLSVPVVLFLTLRLALRSTRSLSGRTETSRGKDFESDDSISS